MSGCDLFQCLTHPGFQTNDVQREYKSHFPDVTGQCQNPPLKIKKGI